MYHRQSGLVDGLALTIARKQYTCRNMGSDVSRLSAGTKTNYKFQNVEEECRRGFIEKTSVDVKGCVNDDDEHFVFDIQHGKFNWKVTKTSKDIQELHSKLYPAIPAVNRKDKKKIKLPPKNETGNYECEALCKFLKDVLENEENNEFVATFFDVSKFSFISELGEKGMEGLINVHSSDYHGLLWKLKNIFTDIYSWCVLKEHCMIFMNAKTQVISGVLQLDQEFRIEIEEEEIEIINGNYKIRGSCKSNHEAKRWKDYADKIIREDKWEIIKKYGDLDSFAPPRKSHVQWFVDGHVYFSAVADAMENAKEQIFITDWIISPAVHLKREGVKDRLHWRLDNVLKRRAQEGVKIYILVYKEFPGTVANQSREAKEYFTELHPNIQVELHPDIYLKNLFWTHHEKLVIIDQKISFIGGIDLAFNRYDISSHPLSDDVEDAERFYRWVGKDYNNLYRDDRLDNDDETRRDDVKYRKTHPRTPWHDVAAVTYGTAARDASRHFIQRWNFSQSSENLIKENALKYLIPKSYIERTFDMSGFTFPEGTEATVQILRSSSEWSTGHEKTECSIHNTYINLIERAKHFIYIENQFFISNRKQMKNRVVDALIKRILKASEKNETFRVYIVIPLLPSAENDIRYDSTSQLIQAILGLQFKTINREEGSFYTELQNSGIDVEKYVSICALRSHGVIDRKPVTGILYVHSKMLIIDDKVTILGSANINDRSLEGDRDSEVDILIEDTQMISSTLNGENVQVGLFSSTLRKRCFAEHCGLLPKNYNEENYFDPTRNIDDVVCEEFFEGFWKKLARNNSHILDHVFCCLPSNQLKNFTAESLQKYEEKRLKDINVIKERLMEVRGHLVEYPLKAFEEEDLTPDIFSTEYMIPEQMFV